MNAYSMGYLILYLANMMKTISYFDGLDVFLCGLDVVYTDSFDQSWPDLFSIQFLHRGSMLFGRNGNVPRRLEAPALYWIEPEHHYFLSRADGNDARHLALFRGPAGSRLMSQGFAGLSPDGFIAVDRPSEVDALFRTLDRIPQTPTPTTQAEARLLLERILLVLATPAPKEVSTLFESIAAAAQYLRDHACEDHDLAEVAQRHGMSYSHFRKCFREQTGRSPHDYVLHFRAQAAAAMLHDRDMQIKEIALACGYADPAEFSRAFRRQLGVSPTMYRRIVGS